jgi:hypothetical protein
MQKKVVPGEHFWSIYGLHHWEFRSLCQFLKSQSNSAFFCVEQGKIAGFSSPLQQCIVFFALMSGKGCYY